MRAMHQGGQKRRPMDAAVTPRFIRRKRGAAPASCLGPQCRHFLRTLATPEPIKNWSLTSLKEKLIKIGAKVVSHGCYVAFQIAEVAIPGNYQEILRLIANCGLSRHQRQLETFDNHAFANEGRTKSECVQPQALVDLSSKQAQE